MLAGVTTSKAELTKRHLVTTPWKCSCLLPSWWWRWGINTQTSGHSKTCIMLTFHFGSLQSDSGTFVQPVPGEAKGRRHSGSVANQFSPAALHCDECQPFKEAAGSNEGVHQCFTPAKCCLQQTYLFMPRQIWTRQTHHSLPWNDKDLHRTGIWLLCLCCPLPVRW